MPEAIRLLKEGDKAVEIHGWLYEQELYPDLFQKAGLIAWRIFTGHIFHDGNK